MGAQQMCRAPVDKVGGLLGVAMAMTTKEFTIGPHGQAGVLEVETG